MRYLALGLFAEGPTDSAFLQRVIYRSVTDIGIRLSKQKLEVQEAFVRGNKYDSRGSRAERIRDAFGELIQQGAVHLLFVHTDGEGDPVRAREDRISPAIALLREVCTAVACGYVPVVPVRETEAWAIADVDALLVELGSVTSIRELIPGMDLTHPDTLGNPKAMLKRIQGAARRTRRRGRRDAQEPIPSGLGDRISLRELRRLGAYQEFERDLTSALKALWGL